MEIGDRKWTVPSNLRMQNFRRKISGTALENEGFFEIGLWKMYKEQ